MSYNKLTACLFNIFISIMITFTTLLFSVNAALDFKPLYYFDVVNLDIQNDSYMTVAEIKDNYNYVINYVNGKTNYDFQLPTLPSSANGKTHFSDVRRLFRLSKIALIVQLILLISFFYAFRKHNYFYKCLKWSGLALLFLPYLLLIILGSNFKRYFTIMHHLLFNNNYWLLDPAEDPIIDLLPQTFFFHCVVLILLLTNLAGIVLYIIYRRRIN
ncbi:MAG: TIGR01906 family membrane protein [Bacillota bacterium]|nr:TIGR01906 family membrane protein [Bacillota bacterium]